jgi:hypothetical protein
MIPPQLKNLKFCRIKKGTKKPFEKDWTNKPYSNINITPFLPLENYGVLCGYEDLAVIDCDEESLQVAVDTLLPKTFKVKTGGGGTHNYYFIPNLKQKIILEAEGKHLGEVQSHGTQVVAPNSTHPNGKKYEVIEDCEITRLSLDELYSVIKNFTKETKETEVMAKAEVKLDSNIDSLSITDVWGTSNLKNRKNEYYGEHPIHGSDGGMNFWVNPFKNTWHCFRCDSGGGPLSAIAVKEGIIQCSEANRGNLRGSKAFEAIKIAQEKYGLKKEQLKQHKKEEPKQEEKDENQIKILWDKELQNYVEEGTEWIIDKMLPNKSVGILTGKRGTLKTFITLLIAYSVASGRKFLDTFKTEKGGVIYLDKENGINIMKKRTQMIKNGMKLDENLDVGFICFSQLKIDKSFDLLLLEKAIEKHKPKLLIVDTYRRGISFDENDAGAVSKLFVDMLRPLSEQFNISILLIHHNRKGGGGEVPDEMDEIRGSSDLANYADVILKTERKGDTLILKQLKNRSLQEEKPIKIGINFEENLVTFTYKGEYERSSKIDKCVEILTLWITERGLKEFSTKDAKEVAFRNGIKESTFKNGLLGLQNIGFIESLGFGTYKVNKQQNG